MMIDKSKINPITTVGVHNVIFHKGQILVIRRSNYNDSYPRHWDFPGGKLEILEQPEETAIREVFEETGLKIKIDSILGAYCEIYASEYWATSILFKAKALTDKVILDAEHTEFKWIPPEKLSNLSPARGMIQKALELLKIDS